MNQNLSMKVIGKLSAGKSLFREKMEVRKTKQDVVYYANFMVRGKRVRTLLGKASQGMNLSRARARVTKLYAEEAAGPKPTNSYYEKTFKQAAEKYLSLQEASLGRNLDQKKQQLRDHLLPFFGSTWVYDLTAGSTERYGAKRKSEDASNGTINRELSVYTHIGHVLVDEKLLSNPFPKPKKLKEEGRRTAIIPDADFAKIIEAAQLDICPHIYPFLMIARNTGMRHTEILSIRIEDVNFDEGYIFVREAKAGKREQPVSDSCLQMIKDIVSRRKVSKGWLFPSETSASGRMTYMKSQWRRVLQAAGLEGKGYTIHTIRHTVVSALAAQGYNTAIIQAISAHKSLSMVQHYTHTRREQARSALDEIEFKPSSTNDNGDSAKA